MNLKSNVTVNMNVKANMSKFINYEFKLNVQIRMQMQTLKCECQCKCECVNIDVKANVEGVFKNTKKIVQLFYKYSFTTVLWLDKAIDPLLPEVVLFTLCHSQCESNTTASQAFA